MGACLSCCPAPRSPTRNGHPHRAPSLPDCPAPPLKFQLEPVLASSATDSDTPTVPRVDTRVTAQPKPGGAVLKPNPEPDPPNPAVDDSSDAKLHLIFDAYRDSMEDSILADGVERLCTDLCVRPDEFRILVLAWTFGAETMCKFTRLEFVGGCRRLGIDSIAGIRAKFPEMVEMVGGSRDAYKDLYRWAFRFALDSELGQRTLPLDMAISMWRVVFSEAPPTAPPTTLVPHWLEFLERSSSVRGITKDTWDMFLNFLDSVDDNLTGYDDTEAWPSLFDDFVERFRDEQRTSKLTRERTD